MRIGGERRGGLGTREGGHCEAGCPPPSIHKARARAHLRPRPDRARRLGRRDALDDAPHIRVAVAPPVLNRLEHRRRRRREPRGGGGRLGLRDARQQGAVEARLGLGAD